MGDEPKFLGVRRAFVCLKCRRRTFVAVTAPADSVPSCDHHGPMTRQANKRYRAASLNLDTEPPQDWGWPKAGDP